jgi:hypothetical protein
LEALFDKPAGLSNRAGIPGPCLYAGPGKIFYGQKGNPMSSAIDLVFPKLSVFDRKAESLRAASPHAPGALKDPAGVRVSRGGAVYPSQSRATALWPDGSVKWLLTSFQADLPANRECVYTLEQGRPGEPETPLRLDRIAGGGLVIHTGPLKAGLGGPGSPVLGDLELGSVSFKKGEFDGPWLRLKGGRLELPVGPEGWTPLEEGPVRAALRTRGKHTAEGRGLLDYEFTVIAWAGKPELEFEYRFIHKEDDPYLDIEALAFGLRPETEAEHLAHARGHEGPTYLTESDGVVTAYSHGFNGPYRVEDAAPLKLLIDENYYEYAEGAKDSFTGTLFADWRDGKRGLSCFPYQAYQNYPKALSLDKKELTFFIVPPEKPVRVFRGSGKRHHFMLRFHRADESLYDLDIRAHQYEYPDRPFLKREAYLKAGVFADYIPAKDPKPRREWRLKALSWNTMSWMGMMNFGDWWDGGEWQNNEYDQVHWFMVQYARTGDRVMFDKMLVYGEHQLDVDFCHYDPERTFRQGGAVEHSPEHANGNVAVCHQWTEGLIDFYHQTGDERALEAAKSIAKNQRALLEAHVFSNPRYGAPRQMGWALRSLASVYAETGDPSLLEPCEKIVRRFITWQEEYGAWLSFYTTHTQVRVPFMQSVAIRALAYYERLKPDERVRRLVLNEINDILNRGIDPVSGRFYYKELPYTRVDSLLGHIFECFVIGYRYTGDTSYLTRVKEMFDSFMDETVPRISSPRNFAECFPGPASYLKALEEAGLE